MRESFDTAKTTSSLDSWHAVRDGPEASLLAASKMGPPGFLPGSSVRSPGDHVTRLSDDHRAFVFCVQAPFVLSPCAYNGKFH